MAHFYFMVWPVFALLFVQSIVFIKTMDFYLIENDGGVFEINLIYTIETAEGFCARMPAMAESLAVPQWHRGGLVLRDCVSGCNW